MQEMKPIKEGKVREIYDNGDSLIMVATDRISCFDVILNNVVTKKSTVLTQMSKFLVQPHEGYPSEPHDLYRCQGYRNFPERRNLTESNMLCRKLNMVPVSALCVATSRAAAGQAIRRPVRSGIHLPEG